MITTVLDVSHNNTLSRQQQTSLKRQIYREDQQSCVTANRKQHEIWSFCFPLSQAPGTCGSHERLHTGSPHTGMPVIPECTVCRAPVRKGRSQPTTFRLPAAQPKSPHLLFLTSSLAGSLRLKATEDRKPAPKESKDPIHLITTNTPHHQRGLE